MNFNWYNFIDYNRIFKEFFFFFIILLIKSLKRI